MKYDEVIQLAKDIHEDGLFRFVAAIEAAAVAAEREACARMLESLSLAHPNRADLTLDQCIAAIRARGEE